MATKDGKKKTSGVRNDSRKNGKAFSKKKYDNRGRALTGRGKPSGRSVKGNRVEKPYEIQGIDLTRIAA